MQARKKARMEKEKKAIFFVDELEILEQRGAAQQSYGYEQTLNSFSRMDVVAIRCNPVHYLWGYQSGRMFGSGIAKTQSRFDRSCTSRLRIEKDERILEYLRTNLWLRMFLLKKIARRIRFFGTPGESGK